MITSLWQRPATIERNHFIHKSLSCWAYNVAVGCAHACRFCISGDTLIQMADGTTRAIAKINIGDKIIGVSQSGPWSKRFVETEVTAKVSTRRLAFRVTTGDAVVICSSDHRWLTTRGWKFATGTEQGRRRRAHLPRNSLIYSIGSHLPPPLFNEEYKKGYLGGLISGDGVLVMPQFRLVMKDPEPVARAETFLAEYDIRVKRFMFGICSWGRSCESLFGIRTSTRLAYWQIKHLVEPLPSDDYARGWLAGFFDAEGSASTRMCHANEQHLASVETYLERLAFRAVRDKSNRRATTVRYLGGIKERMRFYQITAPALKRKMGLIGQCPKRLSRVSNIERLNCKMRMFDITTTCETFIANGLVAHNCYVPDASTNKMGPALEKLGVLDPDAEWGDYVFPRQWDKSAFMRSLNAAESTPPKELNADGNRAVMLCTTTDPYQVLSRPRPSFSSSSSNPAKSGDEDDLNNQMRLLVRDALELMLACPMNGWLPLNVRILTRSPLARRDFDLMKAFGKRLLFGMSLPTLNNQLARIYEPKAPAPSQRLETLRAAQAAGIPVYVAVAPAYPECDAADLEATLRAVRELDPVTIFFEPINIRADNVKRIAEHARSLGVTLNTGVFASTGTWREYAVNQLVVFEALAKQLGIPDHVLHLWPDKSLASLASLAQFQRTGNDLLPWLNHHWHKISQWPK